jgi:alpha-glucosidase
VPLNFLGSGKRQALLVRDEPNEAAAVKIENTMVSRSDALTIELRVGGGFVGRFTS